MAKKYIDADLLKKEINKHYDDYRAKFHQNGERYYLGLIDGIEMTKRIIDSLQQEQSCDTCTNDNGCVTCKDGELWEGKEQPCEDLEKEIERFLESEESTSYTNAGGYVVAFKDTVKIARHFYILGLKNNIPVTQITLAELAKEGELVSKDLEVAAIDFADKARKELYFKDYAVCSIADYDHGCIDGFKAGAEWQKEQMPMPEDTVIFQKGIEEGKRLIMEDAVEGEVCKDHIVTEKPFYFYQSRLIELPDNLKEGDKVKIVIVKEDKK